MSEPIEAPDGTIGQLPSGHVLYDPPDRLNSWQRLIKWLSGLVGVTTYGADSLYGGATMNWAIGGDRLWRLGCCATVGGYFKYRIYTLQPDGRLVEIQITDVGDGRGWLGYDLEGYMCYCSWQGSGYKPASGPARVPTVPPIPVGGGGGTSPTPPPTTTGDITTPCIPFRQNAALNGVVLQDGVIDMHAMFGVPYIPIKEYNIRFIVLADAANVRGRLGPDASNPLCHSVNTPAPNVEAHGCVIVNAGADGNLYYSAINGRPTVWIHLHGWKV